MTLPFSEVYSWCHNGILLSQSYKENFLQTPFTLSIGKTQIPGEKNPGGSEVAASDTKSLYLTMQQSKADTSGWATLLQDVIQGPGSGTPSILWLHQVQHVALKTVPGVEPAGKGGAHGGLHVVS